MRKCAQNGLAIDSEFVAAASGAEKNKKRTESHYPTTTQKPPELYRQKLMDGSFLLMIFYSSAKMWRNQT